MAKLLHFVSREKKGVVIVGHFRTGKEKKGPFQGQGLQLGRGRAVATVVVSTSLPEVEQRMGSESMATRLPLSKKACVEALAIPPLLPS